MLNLLMMENVSFFGVISYLLNGLVFVFLILLTLPPFAGYVLTPKDKKKRQEALLLLLTFVCNWDFFYIYPFWNWFFLHVLLTFLGTNYVFSKFKRLSSTAAQRRIAWLSVITLLSIWIVNRVPLFRDNMLASDSLWSLARIHKWYRWGLWILAVIVITHYWGRRIWNSFELALESLRTKLKRRRIEKRLARAQRFLSRNKFARAADSYRKIINGLNSASFSRVDAGRFMGRAYLGMGHALWGNKSVSEALRSYEHARGFYKFDDLALNRLAQSYFSMQEFDKAYHLLRAYPTQLVDNQVLFARSCLKLRKAAEAISILQKASQKNGNSWAVYYYLGCAHGWLQNYDNAIKSFSTAINIAPDQAAIYMQRSLAYFKLRQYNEALQDNRTARRLGGDPNQLDLVSAAILVRRQDYQTAEQLIQKSRRTETTQLLLGQLWELEGNTEEAIGIYESAIREFSLSARLYERLGSAYMKRNQFERAVQCLCNAIQMGSQSPAAPYNLGWCYYRSDELEKSFACWSKLVQQRPAERALAEQLIQLRYKLAKKYIQDGLFEKAIPEFTQYYQQSKDAERTDALSFAEVLFRAAAFEISEGDGLDLGPLKSYLARARELVPEDNRFTYYLALAEAHSGAIKEAAGLLGSIPIESESDGRILYQLALCQASMGETQLAEFNLISALEQAKSGKTAKDIRRSLAALKMEMGEWSEAADLLLRERFFMNIKNDLL